MPAQAQASVPGPGEGYAILIREVPRLRRYARFLTDDIPRADRLVQDCLSHAILHDANRHADTSMRAWLFVIMHDLYSAAPMALQDGASTEKEGSLHHAFTKLDGDHQKVMLMVGLDGLGHEDTAAALGVSIEIIRERLLKAKSALQQIMTDPLLSGDEATELTWAAR